MDLSTQVVKSFQTLKEMLADRMAYNPDTYAETVKLLADVTPERLTTLCLQHIFTLPVPDESAEISPEAQVRIVYVLYPKFKIADVKRILDGRSSLATTVILISLDKPSSTHAKNMRVMYPKLQMFQLSELMYNLTKHYLVPKHTVLSEEEISSLLAKYSLKSKQQLPHILSIDPMARYLALRPGNVVRIERPSPTAGIYENFRCCVHAMP
jgi:DNA-directed RNA polymerase subunit H (RpoH/RPB5)